MVESDSQHFYTQLLPQEGRLSDLLARPAQFSAVPDDWYIIATDIKDSTAALRAGKHELVNLIATGSIIAVLNIAYARELQIPFFFGGDGATLLVPPTLLPACLAALTEHQRNSQRNFDLELRVGSLALAELYAQGESLRIAKYHVSSVLRIPIVLGRALIRAERIIKGEDYRQPLATADARTLDLQGMECRWNRVDPPENTREVMSLLVQVAEDREQAPVFRRVVALIDKIYGSHQRRNPISFSQLRLSADLKKLSVEVQAKLGKLNIFHLLKIWIITLIGFIYLPYHRRGRHYLRQLVELSDTLVIDGHLNTVISGTVAQGLQLQQALDELEQAGDLHYGFFISRQSVLSCYVRDRDNQHIHFVDGADGGYTQASIMLKRKQGLLP